LDLTDGAIVAEIASMDEKVSVWYLGPFEGVRVGDANHSDWLGIGWR
jgi:hypothetical protein